MERIQGKPRKRLLAFDQSAQTLRQRAQQRLNKGDLWAALSYLRMSADKDGDESGQMDIAEVLAQMGLYDLSSETLLGVLCRGGAYEAECYFALGCNFLAMGYNELSRDALLCYYSNYSDGEFAEDCADMLETLEEMSRDDMMPAMAAAVAADEGKTALDEGRYMEAVRMLTQAVEADGRMLYARNNLALAYYCVHEYDKAIDETRAALEIDKNCVHALSNIAIFLNAKGSRDEARDMVARAAAIPGPDDEDIYKICVTLAELGHDQQAYDNAAAILRYSPYMPSVLFVKAVAEYNLHRPLDSYRTFTRLLLLEPDNAVYAYLHSVAARHSEKTQVPARMEYVPVLPAEQIVKRVNTLNAWLTKSADIRAAAWRSSKGVRALAAWAFTLGEQGVKDSLAAALAELHDEDADAILKRLLLSLNQSDEFKKQIVLMLSQNGAPGPHLALIDDSIAQVSVRVTGIGDCDLPVSYQRVLGRALEELTADGMEAQQAAIGIWLSFAKECIQSGERPQLKAEGAWAAALSLCALRATGRGPRAHDLFRRFATRADAVGKRVDILMATLGGEKDGGEDDGDEVH